MSRGASSGSGGGGAFTTAGLACFAGSITTEGGALGLVLGRSLVGLEAWVWAGRFTAGVLAGLAAAGFARACGTLVGVGFLGCVTAGASWAAGWAGGVASLGRGAVASGSGR